MESERWVEVSRSQFSHEEEGLRLVKDLLPDVDPFRAWSNFEFRDTNGRWHEVDLLVLGRDQLHLVELKHYKGRLKGNDRYWRRGRRAEDSPLLLTHRKAQCFATLLNKKMPQLLGEMGVLNAKARDYVPWVQEAVFLHHPDFSCELPDHSRQDLYGLDGHEETSGLSPISNLLLAPARSAPISAEMSKLLARLLQSVGLVQRRNREVGSWVINSEPLGHGDGWQDWPASHKVTTTNRYRIRFHISKPGSSSADEQQLQRRIEHEHRLLSRLHHDSVQVPRDIITDELGVGLVYKEDPNLTRLDLWFAEHGEGLAWDRQLDIIRQIAEALHYAHRHRVVHRGLTPSAVSLRERSDGGFAIVVADWDAAGSISSQSHASLSSTGLSEAGPSVSPVGSDLADEDQLFEAPEGRWAAGADRVRLDVFALGTLAFYVLTNQTLPAQDRGALVDRLRRDSGLDLAAELPQIPSTLRSLVLRATDPRPSERTPTVTAFLEELEESTKTLTAPEIDKEDPLDASPGTKLAGQFRYLRKLGSGSTAVGILVEDESAGDAQRVLKVAKDDEAAKRLEAEAKVLGALNHERITQLNYVTNVGNRTVLVLQYAGDSTLADELAMKRGRLSIDLLERWGTDLLNALVALDRAGVTHRDIKPANLGVHPVGRADTPHLMLFDFSMAGTENRALTAGTPPYLDPFLGQESRTSYDSAAERYGAAVVLYEMAAGKLPQYGADPDANPASVSDDVTVTSEDFDFAVAEELESFFERALSRHVAHRPDTAEDMRTAWNAIFRKVGRGASDTEDKVAAATVDSTLEEAGLSARAISALKPGIRTVADLLALDSAQVNRLLAKETKSTKQEIHKRIKNWRKEFGQQLNGRRRHDGDSTNLADPIAVAQLLARTAKQPRAATREKAVRLLLGLDEGLDAFATQHELAKAVGTSAPRGHQLIKELQDTWSKQEDPRTRLDQLVDLLVRTLSSLGGVATVETLTSEILAALPDLPPHAIEQGERVAAGLLRLALDRYNEHERAETEERLAKRRHDGRLALLAREPLLLDAAEAAAQRASTLVAEAAAAGESLVTQQRAAREIRPCFDRAFTAGSSDVTATPPSMTDLRMVRLAAQTSRNTALSARGELHARDLSASTAIRLALAGLAEAAELAPDELTARVRARFPQLAPLPTRPDLDAVVEESGIGLRFADGVYRSPHAERSSTTGLPPRVASVVPEQTQETLGRSDYLGATLSGSISARSFLALGVDVRRSDEVDRATRTLASRYEATVLDVTGLLIDEMQSLVTSQVKLTWEMVRSADAAQPGSREAQGLRALVERVLPTLGERIDDEVFGGDRAGAGPLILTELSPLARYGHLNMVARWSDLAARRARAVWTVLPQLSWMRGALVDSKPLQLGSNGQFVELDAEWLADQRTDADAEPSNADSGAQ